jgi:hypothetical protein
MTTQAEIQTALANEARRTELRLRIANLMGGMDATSAAVQRLSSLNSDATRSLSDAQSMLTALEAGAGPGVTADFGEKSKITQFQEAERESAKNVCIEFIKANPKCSEVEAAAAWDKGASASSQLGIVTQTGLGMGRLYRYNLHAAGLIQADAWEEFRGWVVATPASAILGM